MNAKRASLAVVIQLLLATLLVGCSSGPDGASEDAIEKTIGLGLPVGLVVNSVDVQVSENMGTEVQPAIQARSLVRLSVREDFYRELGSVGDAVVVEQTASAGDELSGIVITEARPSGESWRYRILRDEIASVPGRAESQFANREMVVRGSPEHERRVAEVEAAQRAEVAAANAARAAHVARMRSAVAGVWAASQPAFRDGSLWAQNDGGQLGMQLRFEAGEGETGQGIAHIYDYRNPANEIELPFAFRVAAGTESPGVIDITFTATAKHESLNFDFGPRTTWRLSETGELLSTGFRQSWRIAMEKDGEAVANRARIVAAARAERERRTALSIKHGAANGSGQLRRLGLNNNTYGLYLVEGDRNGRVIGDGVYHEYSDIGGVAVHAGLLADGQAGVIKVGLRRTNERGYTFESTERNGVVSEQARGTYQRYLVELIEAVPSGEG